MGGPHAWKRDWMPDAAFSMPVPTRIRATDCELSIGAVIPVEIHTRLYG